MIKAHHIAAAFALVTLLSWASSARAANCPQFTYEQEWLLHAAYAMGAPEDRGYTLAAITWKESFWGREVRRWNRSDGDFGSYGVAHVQATTAMDMEGIVPTPENARIVADLLLADDLLALQFAFRYLMTHSDRPYIRNVQKYNGAGEAAERYARDIVRRVRILERCQPWRDSL